MNKWETHFFCRVCKKRISEYTFCYAIHCPDCGEATSFDSRAARWVSEEKLSFWQRLIGKTEKGHWEYKS